MLSRILRTDGDIRPSFILRGIPEIPVRYGNLLFVAILSVVMVALISDAVVLMVAPFVRKVVAKLSVPA